MRDILNALDLLASQQEHQWLAGSGLSQLFTPNWPQVQSVKSYDGEVNYPGCIDCLDWLQNLPKNKGLRQKKRAKHSCLTSSATGRNLL